MISEYDQRNQEGNCARGACQSSLEENGTWYNRGSYNEYCTKCAHDINRHNFTGKPLLHRVKYGTSEREQRRKQRDEKHGVN